MSQDDGGASAQSERRGGGSVRRARERMNAELNFDVPNGTNTLKNTPNQPSRQPPPPVSGPPRYPPDRQGPGARTKQGGVGVAVSRPIPVAQSPQWPIKQGSNTVPEPESTRSPPRGPPPPRPPRPSNVPSILDSSKVQDYTPSFPNRQPRQPNPPQQMQVQYAQNQTLSPFSDSYSSTLSPYSSTPRTPNTSSDRNSVDRPSTASSTGTIPDFPIPAMPMAVPAAASGPPRRNVNPGPPPTLRRGVSSYYSQVSFVSPIPEEMPEAMRAMRAGGSIASSRAIPSSWGSRPDGFDVEFYMDDTYEEDLDDRAGSSASQHSESQHSESVGLVRQASIGKKAKPTLRTISSSDETAQIKALTFNRPSVVEQGVRNTAATDAPRAAKLVVRDESPRLQQGNRTLMIDTSSSESDFSRRENTAGAVGIAKAASPIPLSRSPLTSPTDPTAANYGNLGRSPSTGMSEKRPEARRPPRLDIDAVRDAEARGSLTSLHDLIRRATRVAANLDRGKTASRLGLWDIMNAEIKSAHAFSDPEKSSDRRRSGSISDILASFPPPALGTPTGERPASRWPSPFGPSNLAQGTAAYEDLDEKKPAKKGRRCCGMPLWVFVVLTIILLALIAAAVLVPVFLIVIPRSKNTNNATAAADSSPEGCINSNPCQNGGVSVFTNNECRCVCVNGFTGSRCAVESDAACTTNVEQVGANSTNATVGSAIPRLLSTAPANFSIQLDNQNLLTLFSSSNISCTSENALVTFDGRSSRRFYMPPEDLRMSEPALFEKRHIDEILVVRQDDATTTTSDGIVYLASSTISGASTPTMAASSGAETTSSGSSSSSSSSSSSTSSSGLTLTSDVLDFARIAILFIAETTNDLSSAMVAQEKLQSFLTGSSSTATYAMEMGSIPTNFTLNFSNFSISLQNGTTLGGRGDGSGGLTDNTSLSSEKR